MVQVEWVAIRISNLQIIKDRRGFDSLQVHHIFLVRAPNLLVVRAVLAQECRDLGTRALDRIQAEDRLRSLSQYQRRLAALVRWVDVGAVRHQELNHRLEVLEHRLVERRVACHVSRVHIDAEREDKAPQFERQLFLLRRSSA